MFFRGISETSNSVNGMEKKERSVGLLELELIWQN